MTRIAYDLILDDLFDAFMRSVAAGSSAPISREELLKRWIACGMSFDSGKPLDACAGLLNKTVKLERK